MQMQADPSKAPLAQRPTILLTSCIGAAMSPKAITAARKGHPTLKLGGLFVRLCCYLGPHSPLLRSFWRWKTGAPPYSRPPARWPPRSLAKHCTDRLGLVVLQPAHRSNNDEKMLRCDGDDTIDRPNATL
ncbi:hypothetical protein GQ53DRAFT_747194, partial [Thozetella sp. PMI_491]